MVCDKPLVHTARAGRCAGRGGRTAGHGFRRHIQLHRLPDGPRRRAKWCTRARSARSARWSSNTTRAGSRPGSRRQGNKQAAWRSDPARSGAAGAIGDIGSHAENLVATVTGLEIESLCADLSALVPGPAARRRRQPAAAFSWRRARRADRLAGQHRARERPAAAGLRHARHADVAPGTAERTGAPAASTGRSASSRAARPGCAKPHGAQAGCRAGIRRASSRPSPMSMVAWWRTSGRGSRARPPILWRPTIRAWKTAHGVCASSNERWPRPPASRNGRAW